MSINNEGVDTAYQVWRSCLKQSDQELVYYVTVDDLADYYDDQNSTGAFAALAPEQRESIMQSVEVTLGDMDIGAAFEKGIDSGLLFGEE
jgi:hypothetical protein